jgi:hypothetical protein
MVEVDVYDITCPTWSDIDVKVVVSHVKAILRGFGSWVGPYANSYSIFKKRMKRHTGYLLSQRDWHGGYVTQDLALDSDILLIKTMLLLLQLAYIMELKAFDIQVSAVD